MDTGEDIYAKMLYGLVLLLLVSQRLGEKVRGHITEEAWKHSWNN